MEKAIESFQIVVETAIYTFEVGKEFAGEIVADIIEHNGAFKLFNRKDELITEIKNFPVLGVKYEYPLATVN